MKQQMFRITPVYDLLLRGSATVPMGLYHLHMATAAQLCRLHYSTGSIKMVKARMKTLVDNGYAHADGIPTKFTRSPYYYTLGQKGMRYLEDTGVSADEPFQASRESNKHSLFIEHTLELNDLIISASLLKRSSSRCYLADFTHERVLKRHPYKASLHTGNNGGTQTFALIPDAFLDFRLIGVDEKLRRLPIVLENDRGTESQQNFRRRIRAYLVMLKTDAYQQLFGVKTLTIAFTTFTGEQRLKQMRDWTRAECMAIGVPSEISAMFLFAHCTQPLDSRHIWLEPCWRTVLSEHPTALITE